MTSSLPQERDSTTHYAPGPETNHVCAFNATYALKNRMQCQLTLSMRMLSGSRLKPSLVRPCNDTARVPDIKGAMG